MEILITGIAGFIGSHLAETLVAQGNSVTGIDNYNTYYDPKIKRRNSKLLLEKGVTIYEIDIRDSKGIETLFKDHQFDAVIHLAAMAGVRPSIQNPALYYDTNINGTLNILEGMRHAIVKRLLFASSSSVYGNNKKTPFSESDNVDYPISPYAATKKAGELMCYNYHHLYGINVACLRFFTVYGPRQRPDMAIHKFSKLISEGKEIPVFNNGLSERDYTFIADIIHGICNILESDFSYDIVNLGGAKTISVIDLIQLLSKRLNREARLNLMPQQPGDVDITFADITKAKETYNYSSQYSIEAGLDDFIAWFKKNNDTKPIKEEAKSSRNP